MSSPDFLHGFRTTGPVAPFPSRQIPLVVETLSPPVAARRQPSPGFLRRMALTVGLVLSTGYLALPSVAPAQGEEPMVYAIGLVTDQPGQKWAYLHWRSTSFDLFAPRAWSVWRKNGLPGDPGEYTLDAVVQLQRHPTALAALFDRAQSALGENLSQTRDALQQLFEEILPDAALSNAELASAILQGVEDIPEFLDSLQIAMRTFPSMAMAMGTAHATPIPASGAVTFEIRQRPSVLSPDFAVVGRVTVNAATPLTLPAPGPVAIVPPEPGRPATSDLSIPLRWASPDELRRLSLAQHGFNVWRVPRALAENLSWHTTPPSPFALSALAADPSTGVGKVNRLPILVSQALDETAALADTADPVFIADHESRFPGFPDSHFIPKNGDQFYYFVSAMDLLRRDGAVSQGVLGTFCSRLPPRVPRILNVENEYIYAGGGAKHHLRIIWEANPPEEDKTTTEYALYRWANTEQISLLGGNPVSNLVAVIPHPATGKTVSYLDDGSGSPSAPGDFGRTWWYTVRAIDDSDLAASCATPPFGGNISGHSPPRHGVLRDRIGPGAVQGGLRIRCADAVVEINRRDPGSYQPEGELLVSQAYVDIFIERLQPDPNLAHVDLFWGIGESSVEIGRFIFPGDELSMMRRLTLPGIFQGQQIWIQASATTSSDRTVLSERFFQNLFVPQDEKPAVAAVEVAVAITYPSGVVDPASGRSPCRAHKPIPPGIDGSDNQGLDITFQVPPGTRQYKLYYQIDDGPLTLLRERSGEFDPNTTIIELWESLPVFAFDVCFFIQAFDRHGNPGPMSPLGCTSLDFKFPPGNPRLNPVVPAGTEAAPTALIKWSAPRYGMERFEVFIHNFNAGSIPIPDGFIFNGWIFVEIDNIPYAFRRYLTPGVRDGFGTSNLYEAQFSMTDQVQWMVYVRGITSGGSFTKLSNLEFFEWTPPEIYLGPNVPWPSRSLPQTNAAAEFHPKIIAKRGPFGSGMIRIGEVLGRVDYFPQSGIGTFSGGDPMQQLFPSTQNPNRRLTHFVLYRRQMPDNTWPVVSGDVVQVSPMMDRIAYTESGGISTIYDPFIYVERPLNGLAPTPANPGYLYLMDTQPALGRGTYRYFLVLFNPVTGEIDEVLETNDTLL